MKLTDKAIPSLASVPMNFVTSYPHRQPQT